MDRDSLVYKAKLAEQAERFDEMVQDMYVCPLLVQLKFGGCYARWHVAVVSSLCVNIMSCLVFDVAMPLKAYHASKACH